MYATKVIPAPIAQLEHQESPQNVYQYHKVKASNGWVMIRILEKGKMISKMPKRHK